MNTSTMTFHESYGNLPKSTLRLIKKFNVSPADWDYLNEMLANMHWDGSLTHEIIEQHIISNSETGIYNPRFF